MTTCIYDNSGMLLYSGIGLAAALSYIDLFELNCADVSMVSIAEVEPTNQKSSTPSPISLASAPEAMSMNTDGQILLTIGK